MTIPPTLPPDWDPGRRQDAARERTDRRRVGWREFRHSYPGIVATMSIAMLVLLAVVMVFTGCKSHPGSREFIPGKGWVPN